MSLIVISAFSCSSRRASQERNHSPLPVWSQHFNGHKGSKQNASHVCVLLNRILFSSWFLPQRLRVRTTHLRKGIGENKSSGSTTLLVQGAIDETCRLWRASLGKNLECLLSHEVAHLLGLCLVFLGDVVPAGIGCVVLAVGGQATWDAHAGAIELPHNPLLLLSWGSYWRGKDEVSSPPKWNWLRCKSKAGITWGKSVFRKFSVKLLKSGSSGP